MTIDWDSIAEEADNTPRSLLAEVLGKVEEVEELIILIRDKHNLQRCGHLTADGEHFVAMLALAQTSYLIEAAKA